MLQTAVFVDAGYLHAQGSALLAGSAQRRERNRLNLPVVLADLVQEAAIVEPNARLLRIYWYDGVARGGVLSHEQSALAQSNNVKCRFGVINSRGQQKGVDSLIVTDLIQLAREQAFSDALILAGDEDLRVGVQVAQTFGIRVHLLGIHPARASQSPDLLAEADTTREWGREKVASWLSIVPQPEDVHGSGGQVTMRAATDAPLSGDPEQALERLARDRVTMASIADVAGLVDYLDQNAGSLPSDYDRPALGTARALLGRDLTSAERRRFREKIREGLRARAMNDGTKAND